MSKKSVFDLDPEQLNQLLSIGKETVEPVAGEQSSSSSTEPQDAPTASLNVFMEKPGDKIGRYKLLSVLGEGGMGIVYLAEQEQPIKRRVALKVIKPGMDSKRVVTRFEAERQALALLDHPNIAHVYDAGTKKAGWPYFVMEYVKGLTITEHCDCHKLTIEDRLNLFRQVCLAVHHAHQKGIIHRDIKPSNILVSTEGDKAIPKIIDFGVAKAIAEPLTERTLVTEQGQLFGTPEYMSPEQADMSNEDIDTRSDIYSLGVLLYVLLTGVLPFDFATLREGGIEHIRKVIRETDPKTPNTRLTSLGDEAKKVAEKRRTDVKALAKKLHNELEWIPLKAMRKDRAERYRSASEFADDIENYLKGEPLIAGPPSNVYRLKKFVRRNRALVTGIAAILVVLVVGIVVSTLFAMGQVRARTEAEALGDFLIMSVLRETNPVDGEAKAVTVLSVLDGISKGLEGRFKDRPLIEAQIRLELGRAYYRIGQFEWSAEYSALAEEHLERACRLYEEQFGEENEDALFCREVLGLVYWVQGKLNKAESMCREAVEGMRRVHGEKDLRTLGARNALALVYGEQGRHDEAKSIWEDLRSVSRSMLGEDHPAYVLFTGNLAHTYKVQGQYDKAEPLFLKLRQLRPDIIHEKDPHIALFISRLADMYTQQGRYAEAEPLYLAVLENRCIQRGEAYSATLATMHSLGRLYKEQQHYDKAESFLLKGVWGRRFILGNEHPDTLESIDSLIELYEAWGKPEQAEEWRTKLPPDENSDE